MKNFVSIFFWYCLCSITNVEFGEERGFSAGLRSVVYVLALDITESMMDAVKNKERRMHRRLAIKMPLEYRRIGVGRHNAANTTTVNVSTGGVYFETVAEDIDVGDRLAFEFAVTPNQEWFPQNGKIATVAEVLRTSEISPKPDDTGPAFTRHGIAAKFLQGFKLTF